MWQYVIDSQHVEIPGNEEHAALPRDPGGKSCRGFSHGKVLICNLTWLLVLGMLLQALLRIFFIRVTNSYSVFVF